MPDRRLSAILAADVVGYSALMTEDQERTLAALRRLRAEVFGPAVAGHRGKLVKSMGDGWLVEFASAIDAVTCAMQLQDRLAGHETIKLRIGVHIGDVVHEDEDVFGDGVNIAARLEALGEPGAVMVSDAVHGALDGTLRPSFDDSGEHRLKNIERPVRVWVRRTAPDVAAEAGPSRAAASGRAGFPLVTISPVMTSDDRTEVRELASALTADLGTLIGATRWLVTQVHEVPDPAGSSLQTVLRARGDRTRLEAQLTGRDGASLWTGKFDGSLADSFDWQDEVGREIAGGALAALMDREKARLAGRTLDELTAADCSLRGLMGLELVNRDAMAETLRCYAAAIEKDPGAGRGVFGCAGHVPVCHFLGPF